MQRDVAIVGAGPIGLATAAELKRRGLSIVQFDKGCIAKTVDLYPHEMRFFSSAQYLELLEFPLSQTGEKPTREEYLAYLRSFVRFHQLKVNTYETVQKITGEQGAFHLDTVTRVGRQQAYDAKYVVLATGANEVPRSLGIPGEDLPHVSHYLQDAHRYFGHRVVVVGARNSACDAAILLTRVGASVTLVHRGEGINAEYLKYWIYPAIKGMIEKGKIDARFSSTIQSIDELGVSVLNGSGVAEQIEADFVLLMVGYKPDYKLMEQLGVDLHADTREPISDESTFETSVPGVFCSGTIVAGDQSSNRIFIENAQHHPKVVADAIEAKMKQ